MEDVDETQKPVDPADIPVMVPSGRWRLGRAHRHADALFLKFAEVSDLGRAEMGRRPPPRDLEGGLLSRSKKETLLARRDIELQREKELKETLLARRDIELQ